MYKFTTSILFFDVSEDMPDDKGLVGEDTPEQIWFFLDDEREAPQWDNVSWAVFRTGEDMLAHIDRFGLPDGISFDHDLGENVMSGHDAAKAIVWRAVEHRIEQLPPNFAFRVHSENPVGRNNITATMRDLFRWFQQGIN